MLDADYPSEWRRLRLHDVAEVRTGLAKGKKDIKDPVKLPYLRVANVQDGHLDLREIKRITVARAEVERYSLQDGDVVLTEGGDFDKLGRGTMWESEIPHCLHQNHVFVVRADRDELLPEYLVWLTNSPHGREYFRRCSKQSTNLASINTKQLKRYPLVLPEMEEQLRIARVLRCADRGVDIARRLLKARRKLKRGLLQKVLTGERRFPEFRDQPWVERRFGDFLTESRIAGSHGATAKKLSIRLYGKGVYVRTDPREGSEQTQYYRRSAGQLVYSKLDFLNGAFGIVPAHLDGYESTLDVPAFDIADDTDPRWLLYLLTYDGFYKRQLGLAHGGRKARRVNPDAFLDLAIPMPERSEQTRIADLFETLDRDIQLLTDLHEALKEQKKGLMQQLLTGKVRVPASMLKEVAHA